MKKLLLILTLLFGAFYVQAQVPATKPIVDWVTFVGKGTAPTSPVDGQLYLDTSTSPSKLYFYDLGTTSWVEVGTGSGGGAVDSVNGFVGAVTLDLALAGDVLSLSGDGTTVDLSGYDQIATGVPFTPAGTIAATNVQAAIEEVAAEAGGGGGTDDQIASEVPLTPTGRVAATDVQAGIAELEQEKLQIDDASPETNVTAAFGTGAQLDLLGSPGAGEFRLEFQTDFNDIASDYYVTNFTENTVGNTTTLTLTRSGSLNPLAVSFATGGDMLQSVYDIGANNIVDNSEALGGVAAANYLRSDQSDSMTGNLSITGTVDGRDVSVDGTKLDGIEASAKDDQIASEVPFTPAGTIAATNVQAAIEEVAAEAGSGSGDMLKSVYDTGDNGIVDNAENLGGSSPATYLDNTDSQTLSYNAGSLSISGGNSVSTTSFNAGQVDGLEGSQFLRSDASDTYSGSLLSFSNGSLGITTATNLTTYSGTSINASSGQPLVIEQTGSGAIEFKTDNSVGTGVSRLNIPAGATQVSFDFQNNHITDVDDFTANGAISFSAGTSSTTKDTGAVILTNGGLGVEGNINAGGDITAFASSDERLKYNIKPVSKDPLKDISAIRGVEYEWKGFADMLIGKRGKDVGVIAQEVEAVMPEAVREGTHGYKQVNYDKLIPLMIEAIKAQQEEIEILKDEVRRLKKDK